MRMLISMAACVSLCLVAAASARTPAPVLSAKAPNLVPIASRMQKGTISVRNTGSAAAGAFKVTVECNVMGGRGGCADPSPRQAAPYEDPAFPNKVTITVPGLAQGKVYNHKIAFWNALAWSSGNYEFCVVADAAGVIAETNEGDNNGCTVFSVP